MKIGQKFSDAANAVWTGVRQPGNKLAHVETVVGLLNLGYFVYMPNWANACAAIAMFYLAADNYHTSGKKALSEGVNNPSP